MMFVEQMVGLLACQIALAWQSAEETWMGLPGAVGAWARKDAYDRLWAPPRPVPLHIYGREKTPRRAPKVSSPPLLCRGKRVRLGDVLPKQVDIVERAGFSLMTLWEGWHPSELAGAGD